MDQLELTVDLQRLSFLAVAQSIWSSKSMETRIKNLFVHMNQLGGFDEWDELMNEVLKNTKKLPLPKRLKTGLLEVVKVTGVRIYDWYFYLRNMNLFTSFTEDTYRSYLERIYWTNVGTIDEVKILKQFWLRNPNVDLTKIFQLACLFCCTDVIDELWEKLSDNFRNADYPRRSSDQSYIILYWIFYKKSALDNFLQLFNQTEYYDPNLTLEENLMKFAVINGQHLAAKYFWSKFSPEEKINNVMEWFKNGFQDLNGCRERDRLYKKDQYLDIYILLFNYMTMDMKRAVLILGRTHVNGDDYSIYSFNFWGILAWAYPWQELFIEAFSQVQEFFKGSMGVSYELVKALKWNSYLGIGIEDNAVRRQISMFWNLLFPDLKMGVAQDICPDLFHFNDVENLKLIFNDSDLIEHRDELFTIGYETLLRSKKTKSNIAKIAREVFVFEDWNENIKEIVQNLYGIILNEHDIDEAKKYLNSQSNEEKKEILSKINHEFVSYFLFRENALKSLKNYCEWVFPFKNELNNFKDSLKNDRFTLDLIYKVWRSPSETNPEGRCDEFLKWILSSDDEEISDEKVFDFRKNTILNDLKRRQRDVYVWPLHNSKSSEFLSWCFCSKKEEKKHFKTPYINTFLGIHCREAMKSNDLDEVKSLFDLLFDSENEKNAFKHKYITSKDGCATLMVFVGNVKSKEIDSDRKKADLVRQFKSVIDFWIKSLETCLKVEERFTEAIDNKFHNPKKDDIDFFLKLEQYHELAICPWDQEWRDSEDWVIWNEENFKLFLGLIVRVRAEMENEVTIN